MAVVTITQTTYQLAIEYPGTAPRAHGWYTQDFIAGDGVTPVLHGNGQTGFYIDLECHINSSGYLVVPAFSIQATNESNPTSRFFLELYTQDGAAREILMGGNSGWVIPAQYGSFLSIDQIARYNRASQLLYAPATYPTYDQMLAEIRRMLGNQQYAMVGILGIVMMRDAPLVPSEPTVIGDNSWGEVGRAGIVELDTAPDDPEHPIAVGINSPLLVNTSGGALRRGVATLVSSGGESKVEVTGISQVATDSPILVLPLEDSVTGDLQPTLRVAGDGFTIVSENGFDAGDVAWFLYSSI